MVNEVVDPHQVTLVVTVWYIMSFSKAMMAHSHLMKRSNFQGVHTLLIAGRRIRRRIRLVLKKFLQQ
jgi:hypothetical protein